jgi:ABC-type multidrug transport system ATPase subunit
LNQLHLPLYKNEIFCLLGHNGAGKTTLLQIISGMLAKDSGEFRLNQKNVDSMIGKVGLCPQTDILVDQLSALDHVNLACALCDEQIKQAKEYLHEVRLEESSWRKPIRELSGGMKRKVSVAIALVGNPEIFGLDEPTSSMDPESC